MATHLVNLEALIARDDFESGPTAVADVSDATFKIAELERTAGYFKTLRKPDFQRETASWTPEMIMEFIRSFLDSELIPSLIVWQSKATGKNFLIDGSHRVSALIAWVNDDYGDGAISREFYSHNIPERQAKLHKQTKDLIEGQIGSYKRIQHIGINQKDYEGSIDLRRARIMFRRNSAIQTVEGDALTAEASFFRINGSPAIIDETELDILQARKKPNAIATRALVRAGNGHKYWGTFLGNLDEIEGLAKEVFDLIFGNLTEITSQSADLPRAGQPYSSESFRMILDLVNTLNDISEAMWRRKKKNKKTLELPDDLNGSETIRYLKRIKSAARLIVGAPDCPESLGIDPAVYFFGTSGKFHPSTMLASIMFFEQLNQERRLVAFMDVRKDFEEFLVRHKSFINQLNRLKGSGPRPLESLITLYRTIMDCLVNGSTEDAAIVAAIQGKTKLSKLTAMPWHQEPDLVTTRRRFSKTVQEAAVVRDLLGSRERCPECGARLPPYARSKDHHIAIEDGGLGTLNNLVHMHPYCNTGYKQAKRTRLHK